MAKTVKIERRLRQFCLASARAGPSQAPSAKRCGGSPGSAYFSPEKSPIFIFKGTEMQDANDRIRELSFDRNGFVKLPGGGVACSVARAAELLDLTVQRFNQLAHEGVVVKVGRGLCNFTASLNRYAVYSAQPRWHGGLARTSLYWDMKTRESQLRSGATAGEVCELRRRIESIHKLVDELSGAGATALTKRQLAILAALSEVLQYLDKIHDNALTHIDMILKFNREGTL